MYECDDSRNETRHVVVILFNRYLLATVRWHMFFIIVNLRQSRT